MKNIVKGFKSFFTAFGFVFSNRLVGWYLVPILLYLVLVIGFAFSLASFLSPWVTDLFNQFFGLKMGAQPETFWAKVGHLFTAGISIAISIAMKIMIWYLLGRVMKYVILIVMSPLLAYLSERTEEIKSGKIYPFNLLQLLKDALRGVAISLRNLIIELFFIGLGFVISFSIPLLAPLVTVVLFVVNCYFMGFSMFDYISERRKLSIAESILHMRNNMGTVFGLGLAYNAVSMVPFADWVIAPINGSIGAVLVDLEVKKASSAVITKP